MCRWRCAGKRARVTNEKLHLAPKQSRHGWPGTAIGHVNHLGLRLEHESFRIEMDQATGAARRERDFSRIGLGVVDQFFKGVDRQRRRHRNDGWTLREIFTTGVMSLSEFEGHVAVDSGVHGIAAGNQQ